jgi:hypothetical protein
MSEAKVEKGAGVQPSARADLRVAWDELLTELGRARDAVDHPRLHPPPPTDRNLAEGYRHLLGTIYGAIERALNENPDYPYFRRQVQYRIKESNIDNADNLYLTASIDGDNTYLVTGKAQDHRHWRGESPAASGPKAPQYVYFDAGTMHYGDSGTIAELSPAILADTGTLDSAKLQVEPDGSLTILLASQRPDGYTGNFIATKALVSWIEPDGTTKQAQHTARCLYVRELFYDWEREEALELQIVRVGAEGTHPGVLELEAAVRQMKRAGEIARNHMRYWNEYQAVLLELYGAKRTAGTWQTPRNDLTPPGPPPSSYLGLGQNTNVFSRGVYDLEDDEALIIEEHIPVPPAYIGFTLSNFWAHSLDYANHAGSLNGFQSEFDADGSLRYVIAHRDPGVPNWLDTTGLPQGFMVLRWTYPEVPDRCPTVKVTKVPFDKIRSHLPASVRTVSPEERRNQIRIRQEHVQRRYRQY